MSIKIFAGVVVVAFVGLQLANALTCYSCDTPYSCQNPGSVQCNDVSANATTRWLNSIHSNVPQIAHSSYFKCVNLTYYLNSPTVKSYEYLGCYHPNINICNLNLNISHGPNWSRRCLTCDKDYCNRNPAATFSQSSYTIVASVLGLLIAKLLV